MYWGVLGGGKSTQATATGGAGVAAGVATEGVLGDDPPEGLCVGVGELTGTVTGVPEGVVGTGVPGVPGKGVAAGRGGELIGVKVNMAGVAVDVLPGAAGGVLPGVVPGVPGVLTGAAGVAVEGEMGDAPEAGLCEGDGELAGTAPGVPEGVGGPGVPGVPGEGLAAGLGGELIGVKVNVAGVAWGVLLGTARGVLLTGEVTPVLGDPDCTGGKEGEGLAGKGLGEVGRGGGTPTKPGLILVLGLAGVGDLVGVAPGGTWDGWVPGGFGAVVPTGVGLLPAGTVAGDCAGPGGKGLLGVGTLVS